MSTLNKLTQRNAPGAPAQVRLARRSPAYWGVTIDAPPINGMGPAIVKQFQGVMAALEADEQVFWKSRGAEFMTEPIPENDEIRCSIRDPGGYIIEVGQSTTLAYG